MILKKYCVIDGLITIIWPYVITICAYLQFASDSAVFERLFKYVI